MFDYYVGLSPRVRGNPCPGSPFSPPIGSIPACAGEPIRAPLVLLRMRVYPRVCGGTYETTSFTPYAVGLSPRVRGNHGIPYLTECLDGSIPACAGEPLPWGRGTICSRVYPRVCGGTLPLFVTVAQGVGLSPRVRGNRCCSPVFHNWKGSIPACAGEPGQRPGDLPL